MLAVVDHVKADDWWVVGLLLIISGASLLPYLYSALKRPITIVLADHLLVLAVAFFVYFIIGALLLSLGPHDEVEFAMSYYRINASKAVSVAAFNSIGFGFALMISLLAPKRIFSRLSRLAVRVGVRVPLEWVIALFLIIGLCSYIYVWIFDANPQPDTVISGSWRSLSNLLLAAIILGAAHQGSGAKVFRFLSICIAMALAFSGLLLLNKGQVMMPILALCMGYIWRLGVRRVALPSLVIILTIFLIIASPVATVRNLYGASSKVEFDTRIPLLWDGIVNPKKDTLESDYYPWARFCYTPSQAAAIDLYDSGNGGTDIELIGWVFLPRFLFPNKPVITATGQEFNYKLTGSMNSSTGQGVFVNGYYNLGFIGVVFSGLGVGFILTYTSLFAAFVFKSRALIWLPFALLGSYMAFRIDGFFIGDFLGPFSLLLYGLIGIMIISKILNQSKRKIL
ncbi:hypothetical protein [Polaromonas sp. CG_23.6]|uniref:hypothetical protein n=1 Tax=Polaromonas sp. CG_23.6 TaxID=2760709 RepID=UPI002474CEDD|nr:hypothetical protein [Polaromonas sp. CG_23.6]MDH6185995.1 hypothetical protein [Polaromonas sp. CG_23.6]